MAENQVQIEVELVGQKEVGKGLQNITKGAEGVGETFKSVGDVVGKHLGTLSAKTERLLMDTECLVETDAHDLALCRVQVCLANSQQSPCHFGN